MSYLFSRITVAIYSCFIFTVSVIPVHTPKAVSFPNADKIVHFAMYFLLSFILVNTRLRSYKKYPRWFTFFYCFFFGFAIECIQYFLPYRSFELLDQAANSFGAFAGLFIIIRKNKAAD